MEVVILPQLSGAGSGGGGSLIPPGDTEREVFRDRMIVGTISEGELKAVDHAVVGASLPQVGSVKVVLPPRVSDYAREFIVRLTVESLPAPEILFSSPDESITFEGEDADNLRCEKGKNTFFFKEVEQGVFMVRLVHT